MRLVHEPLIPKSPVSERRDKMEYLARYQGEPVEVIDRNGWVHRGVIEWVDPVRGGMFLRTGFRRRFIPFFLIAALFLLRFGRRRIF
jgi:hypothetical protein